MLELGTLLKEHDDAKIMQQTWRTIQIYNLVIFPLKTVK